MAKKIAESKKTPAVSIIIPMYNAERYIEPCLQSLLNQTSTDFEVIIVDDCSTDQSPSIVKSFFELFDDRLTLLKTKKNSGLPWFPRNLAMKSARGKYIAFLDNDDMLEPRAMEVLVANAETFNADFVLTEKYLEIDGENLSPQSYQRGEFVTKPVPMVESIGERIANLVNYGCLWDVWGKLFRREFLIRNRIEFPQVILFEDFCFFVQALVSAKVCIRIPDIISIHRNRPDSLSHDPPHPFDITRNMIDVFRLLDRFLSNHDFFINNRKYRYMLLDFFVRHRLRLVAENIYALSEPSEIDEYLRRYIFNVNPKDNVALTCHLFDLVNVLYLENEQLRKEIPHGK